MKLGRASAVKAWAKRTAQLPLVLTTSPFPSPLRRWPCRRCSVDSNGASYLQQPTTQDKTNFNLDVNEGLARSAPFNAVTSPSDDHKKIVTPTTQRYTSALEDPFLEITRFLKLVLSWVGCRQFSSCMLKACPAPKKHLDNGC